MSMYELQLQFLQTIITHSAKKAPEERSGSNVDFQASNIDFRASNVESITSLINSDTGAVVAGFPSLR